MNIRREFHLIFWTFCQRTTSDTQSLNFQFAWFPMDEKRFFSIMNASLQTPTRYLSYMFSNEFGK
ncbi:MAG: hypothetical protein CMI29_10155 [Opitutae bacterium]|nr:hypothetical protein [Opitutae bacterium]